MKTTITELTDKQKAKFPEYVDKFLKIGLSTERSNRVAAEEAMVECYKIAGLSPPKTFVWFDSPFAAVKYIKQTLKQKNYSAVYGSQDASWLAFYEYFRVECGLEICNKLIPLTNLSKHAGWCFPYNTLCIMTEKPTEIHFDFEKRTHSDKGYAIKYADGTGVAVFHGVRIPSDWVHGKLPSASEAISWPQMEQRRAACELIGWNSILKQLNSRVINRDADPMVGELIEADLPDSPNEKFLRVMCGTGREFVLSVPKEMKTALEANAWTYNIPSDILTSNFVRT